MDHIYNEILNYVNTLEIIDTHEHLPGREEARDKQTDVLKEYLTHYFNRDLISAGLGAAHEKVIDPKLPLMERWELVEPYWEAARYTGYGRALDISVQALYGIERISRETLLLLNEAFQRSLQPGHYQKVLKEKSKIVYSLLDQNLYCDPTFFRSVYRLDHFIAPRSREEMLLVEREAGIRLCSFEDWLEACEIALDKALKAGAVALKSGLAYRRTLRYERVPRSEAEADFNQLFQANHLPEWETRTIATSKKLQDYMMHHILRLASKRHLTYQFHTGLQESSGNIIYNSDPALLSNLFLEYPNVDFDIFHIGYPYQQTLSALSKNFSNVYIDMCWAHIISPTASVNALVEWLDAVPYNKISAFGGDYCFVDAIYGHQYLARVDVSKALAIKVQDGVFGVEKAKEIARALFYDNPLRIFKLK
jgi:hypothetical protein